MSGSGKKLFGVIVCDSQAKWGGPEGIGQRIKNLMAIDGEEWKTFKAEQGEFPTEQDLETFQGFYITGSDHSANDDTPWIQKLESFIQQAYHLKKPKVYGTCFGHQAIGKALGGKVTKNPSHTFVCNNEIIVLSESKSVSSFLKDVEKISELRKPFRMLVAHEECVSDLPKNAKRIASSDSCVNEIVLYSENIIGVQSHVDFYVEDLKDIILPSLLERNLITKENFDKVNDSLKLPNVCGDLVEAVKPWLNDTTLLYNIIELCLTEMLDDRPNCHKVLDQHVWREIEITMAALQAKRKFLAIYAILELLEDDKTTNLCN